MIFEERLNEIMRLLEEKDHDSVVQIAGYIEIDSDDYITRYGNAR